ncbi:MAG: transcriptional regulator MraZ [Deltaproteobacteria bacterium]|jgi:MraZ protein|nr:Transcriptional regulator MraZ [bacterium HR37]GIW46647.1 MAG: transcriptional regulator MraZ [Deltaproteobacteria bacterium]
MFRGRYEHTMTDKGRISVPAKFREVLRDKYGDETLIVTNFDRCLVAYPLKEWNEIERKVAELPQFRQEVISFLRYLMGGAVDCPIDGQGRILIPQSLRNHARIKREVVMIGMLTRFEIWAKEIWEEEESKRAYEEFIKSKETLAGQGL